MGSNVERLLEEWGRMTPGLRSCAHQVRQAIEADREQRIPVRVTSREVTGAKIRVHDLHTLDEQTEIEPGEYDLVKRTNGGEA